jgi:hypothetical protein
VIETRDTETLQYSRRRRQCNACKHRITTVEFIVELDTSQRRSLLDIAIVPRRDLIEMKRLVASWTDAPILPPEALIAREDDRCPE